MYSKTIQARKEVLKRAHALKNKLNPITKQHYTFGEAQRHAWKVQRIKEQLKTGTTSFAFVKKSTGQLSNRVGTTNLRTIPTDKHPNGRGTSKKINPLVIRFFDLDKKSWRSFSAETLAA